MPMDIAAANTPFLEPNEKDINVLSEGQSSIQRRRSFKIDIIVHLVLIVLYTGFSATFISSATRCSSNVPRRVLDELSIAYEPYLFRNLTHNNSFAGPPSPSVDVAWESLLSNINLRVTASELGNLSSVSLPNGGHLAWLAVAHNIHCLNLLRKWLHRPHYFPALTPNTPAYAHEAAHAEHCIERLRQESLCHADVSALTVFTWSPATPKPMFDNTERVRSCVDWERLMGSLRGGGRVVGEAEWERLRNPLLERR